MTRSTSSHPCGRRRGSVFAGPVTWAPQAPSVRAEGVGAAWTPMSGAGAVRRANGRRSHATPVRLRRDVPTVKPAASSVPSPSAHRRARDFLVALSRVHGDALRGPAACARPSPTSSWCHRRGRRSVTPPGGAAHFFPSPLPEACAEVAAVAGEDVEELERPPAEHPERHDGGEGAEHDPAAMPGPSHPRVAVTLDAVLAAHAGGSRACSWTQVNGGNRIMPTR